MLIGIDAGTSATKIACTSTSGELLFTSYEPSTDLNIKEILDGRLLLAGAALGDVEAIAVTGMNWAKCAEKLGGLPIEHTDELQAIGAGSTYLAGRDEAIVAGIGTGTAFILARDGRFTHLGGTGVGSGTLAGLGKKILGTGSAREISELAAAGKLENVDLLIGDIFEGSETLDVRLTSSNLAKALPDATDGDWAAGLMNLVYQVVGTIAVIACGGHGVGTVIVTGGLANREQAKTAYERFQTVYGIEYIIPPKPHFATAIGAARRLLEK